jgi:hypothetical protein
MDVSEYELKIIKKTLKYCFKKKIYKWLTRLFWGIRTQALSTSLWFYSTTNRELACWMTKSLNLFETRIIRFIWNETSVQIIPRNLFKTTRISYFLMTKKRKVFQSHMDFLCGILCKLFNDKKKWENTIKAQEDFAGFEPVTFKIIVTL